MESSGQESGEMAQFFPSLLGPGIKSLLHLSSKVVPGGLFVALRNLQFILNYRLIIKTQINKIGIST